ncbi:MAG: DUF4190 domain-containing protein [Marmoricola sp.]
MSDGSGPDQPAPPPPPQPGYGEQQPGYSGGQQYGAQYGPQYGQQHPGYPQQPYSQQPGYPYGYPAYSPPTSSRATTALVLGLVGVIGSFLTCGLALAVSPFAWAIGVKARREVQESQGQLEGGGMATAGVVLGIIGTVLLVIALIVLVFVIFALVSNRGVFTDGTVV